MKTWPQAVGYGLLMILVLVTSMSLILSLLLQFTDLTTDMLTWLFYATAFIALFIGGFIAGGKGKEKGWILGGLTGIAYTMLIFLIQYLGYNDPFDAKQWLFHLMFLLIAMFGGIFGVNLRSDN